MLNVPTLPPGLSRVPAFHVRIASPPSGAVNVPPYISEGGECPTDGQRLFGSIGAVSRGVGGDEPASNTRNSSDSRHKPLDHTRVKSRPVTTIAYGFTVCASTISCLGRWLWASRPIPAPTRDCFTSPSIRRPRRLARSELGTEWP
eukprot:6396555-Prymnesium_polylepis.3